MNLPAPTCPVPAALELQPPPARTLAWLLALCSLPLLALLALQLPGARALVPIPAPGPVAWLAGSGLPLLAAGPVLANIRRRGLALAGAQLEVRGALHVHRCPLAGLDLAAARVLDLDSHGGLRPDLLSGQTITLPGLRHGLFRLGNGQRAFVAVSDGSRVLWIPPLRGNGTRGTGLLLQPRDPAALLQLLRTHAAPSTPAARARP